MNADVDSYLAHMGVEVDPELKHFGKKGMKWGVRKDAAGGAGKAWTADQKQKLKNVAIIAGVAAVGVGAAYVAQRYYGGADAKALESFRSGIAKAGASFPSAAGPHVPLPKGYFKDVAGTRAAGRKVAETVIKAKGGA